MIVSFAQGTPRTVVETEIRRKKPKKSGNRDTALSLGNLVLGSRWSHQKDRTLSTISDRLKVILDLYPYHLVTGQGQQLRVLVACQKEKYSHPFALTYLPSPLNLFFTAPSKIPSTKQQSNNWFSTGPGSWNATEKCPKGQKICVRILKSWGWCFMTVFSPVVVAPLIMILWSGPISQLKSSANGKTNCHIRNRVKHIEGKSRTREARCWSPIVSFYKVDVPQNLPMFKYQDHKLFSIQLSSWSDPFNLCKPRFLQSTS